MERQTGQLMYEYEFHLGSTAAEMVLRIKILYLVNIILLETTFTQKLPGRKSRARK